MADLVLWIDSQMEVHMQDVATQSCKLWSRGVHSECEEDDWLSYSHSIRGFAVEQAKKINMSAKRLLAGERRMKTVGTYANRNHHD